MTPDREGFKQFIKMVRDAFPDFHDTVEDLIAENDKVVLRVTCTGTHKGEFMGVPPTGKQVTVSAIAIYRFAGGKAVEHWNVTDRLSLMQQLGVIPPME